MSCLQLTYRAEESSPLKVSWNRNGQENPCTGVENLKYNRKELQPETQWYDYGARMYDPWVARWNHIDPAGEEYFSTSPYVYALNTPINAIDPDGKRVFFVAGAGNDSDGWNYVTRWGNALSQAGIGGFTRINASGGQFNDIMFTSRYRHSGYKTYSTRRINPNATVGLAPISETDTRTVQHEQIDNAVGQIRQNLADNSLAEGAVKFGWLQLWKYSSSTSNQHCN